MVLKPTLARPPRKQQKARAKQKRSQSRSTGVGGSAVDAPQGATGDADAADEDDGGASVLGDLEEALARVMEMDPWSPADPVDANGDAGGPSSLREGLPQQLLSSTPYADVVLRAIRADVED
eukprot:5101922-Alexandrium_andersonii.AAC.1